MLIIKHRVNTILELDQTPVEFGVELDVHYDSGNIFVGHEPNDREIKFSNYLSRYRHSILAVNIKQEGIEKEVIDILEHYQIKNYFLFDLSFPSLVNQVQNGQSNIALRISDYEEVRRVSYFRDKVDWIWLDVFHDAGFLDFVNWSELEGFKKCVVSPELHAKRDAKLSDKIRGKIETYLNKFDAICTKNEAFWGK